jgi:hypothetical protein
MSDNFDTAGFREWWEEAKQKYDGDSQLCALRAWQHQQQRIKQLESLLGRIHKATDQFYTQQKEDKKPDPVPYQEIVDLYHKVLPDLPKVVKLTDKRKRAIRNRWHRDLETRTDWALYFKDAARKPFLFGRNDRGWVANFDFLLREQTITFMQEGKYDG